MRAAIALLPNQQAQVQLHKLALGIHHDNPGMRWVQLPFHVSLKQAFAIEEVDAVDTYFQRFAATLQPIHVETGDPELVDESIFWLPITEDAVLRQLHERLNQDLGRVVADPTAPFDGPSYRFHLSLGFLRGTAPTDLAPHLRAPSSRLLLEEASLFLFDEYEEGQWQFTSYRTLTLGSSGNPVS